MTKKTENRVDYKFGSVAAMRAYLSMPCGRSYNESKARYYMEDHDSDTSWFGMKGNAATIVAAQSKGWPEGQARIAAMRSGLVARLPRAEGVQRRIRRGDTGDNLDIHAVYRGAMDKAWTASRRTLTRASNIVRIVVDVGGNCSSSASAMQWRGVAGVALSDILTAAGYAAEIVAAFSTVDMAEGKPGSVVVCQCTVKPYRARPDAGLLSATAALPGFFRTMGFAAIIHAADELHSDVTYGLGRTEPLSSHLQPDSRVMELFVPSDINSEATAREWAQQTLQLFGGKQ